MIKQILSENGKWSLGRVLVFICGLCALCLSIVAIIKAITNPSELSDMYPTVSTLWGLALGGKGITKLTEKYK